MEKHINEEDPNTFLTYHYLIIVYSQYSNSPPQTQNGKIHQFEFEIQWKLQFVYTEVKLGSKTSK